MGCCQLIFNELCLEPPAPNADEVRRRLHELRRLVQKAIQRTGASGLRVTEDFDDRPISSNYSFRAWRRDEAVDKDERRLLARFIDRGTLIDEDDPPEILGEWENRGVEARWNDRPARGLFAAFLLDSLALSLDVEPWNDPFRIDLHILRLTGSEERETLGRTVVQARHAARSEHLKEHKKAWLGRSTDVLAVYRRQVDPWKSQHVPASKYAQGKHVRGQTNDERRQNAIATRNGQFVAELQGRPVTDSRVSKWEREALLAAWEGSDIAALIRHEHGNFHLEFQQQHPVGFTGGSGRETRRMRVEWSSGHVHSHPRER